MKKFLWILLILIILGVGVILIKRNTTRLGSTTPVNNITGMANPASVFCVQNSGTLEIVTDLSGGQSGICHLPDGTACDEWAYFSGECPTTGVALVTGVALTGTTLITGNISGNTQEEILLPYYLKSGVDCGRKDSEGKPDSGYFEAAKFVNKQLQAVWTGGEVLAATKIDDLSGKLLASDLDEATKCEYSRAIDALQHQPGYLKHYSTTGGVITIGIDFVTYKDASGEIDFGPPDQFFQTQNTAKKIREYPLAASPDLQTLDLDISGYTSLQTVQRERLTSGIKYLNNFDARLSEFCNGQPIYNGIMQTDASGNAISEVNRNENNMYCVRDNINKLGVELFDPIFFNFDASGDIQGINLNRWHLVLAG